MTVSLKARPKGAPIRTTGRRPDLWRCQNPLSLTCTHHGNRIEVPCGRWRKCPACARRLQYKLRSRFLAGIEQVRPGMHPMFFTLTFPAARDPKKGEAQKCWRALVRRLRQRRLLGEYGIVWQRTKAGTLHAHGIAFMPFMPDGLVEWRELIVAAGFGVQNKLVIAKPSHAGYVTRYISTRLATLPDGMRAYQFSRNFPQPRQVQDRRELEEALNAIGARTACTWELTSSVASLLRG
jgi:hypothetical protein